MQAGRLVELGFEPLRYLRVAAKARIVEPDTTRKRTTTADGRGEGGGTRRRTRAAKSEPDRETEDQRKAA